MEATYASVLRMPGTNSGSFSPAAYAVISLTALSLLSSGLCAVLYLRLGFRYALVTLVSFYIYLGHLTSIILEVDALTSSAGPKAPYTPSRYTSICEYITILVSNGTSISILFWCYAFFALVSGYGAEHCTRLLGTFRVLSVVIPLVMMGCGIFLDLAWPHKHVAYAVVRDFFAFSLPFAALMVVAGALRLIKERRDRTDRVREHAITLSVCFRFVIAFMVLSVIAPFYLHDRISTVYLFPDRSRADLNSRYTNESWIVGYAGLALQGLGCFLVFGTAKIAGSKTTASSKDETAEKSIDSTVVNC